MHGSGWMGMGWMWVFWLLVLVACVSVVVCVIATARGGRLRDESSEEILKARYARGEIGKEEYEQRMKDIQ